MWKWKPMSDMFSETTKPIVMIFFLNWKAHCGEGLWHLIDSLTLKTKELSIIINNDVNNNK